MRNLYLVSKEDFKNLLKNPMWLFYATLFPILLVVILGFLMKDNYGSDVTSYDYYGITLMIYSILMSGMTSANAFMEVTIRKPNMRIIYAPGNPNVIYLSKIVSSFVFCGVCHLFDLLVICMLFQIRIQPIAYILPLLVLLELFSVSLGVMCCCIFKTEAMANQILSMVINLLAIFGGLMFPMDGYGKVIRTISHLSPAKWMVQTSFSVIYDNDFSRFVPTIIGLILATVAVFGICKITFRKEDCVC
jgi:ABC-2 type transport system permease protein